MTRARGEGGEEENLVSLKIPEMTHLDCLFNSKSKSSLPCFSEKSRRNGLLL